MRESWFTNFTPARTVGDIASLCGDDEICASIHSSQSTATICDIRVHDDIQKMLRVTCEDSCITSGHIEASDSKSDEDSLYSMESADQDAHPLLLSMPIIPQIKLERKATVRKPEPAPLLDAIQNQTFLSPRIPDLRTPARMSSRRYGRILAGPNVPVVVPDATKRHEHDTPTFQAYQRYGTTSCSDHAEDRTSEPAYRRPVSEPMLSSSDTSDNEEEPLLKKEVEESPHSDLLLSLIDEVGSSPGPHNVLESSTNEPLRPEEVPSKCGKRGHQRSSVSHSISFSSIIHAVVDGCASLDLLRKPKSKRESTTEPKPVPNAHDPSSKWAPKHGQIVIKVFVPSADDIWMFRVPQNINLVNFASKVVTKLGFVVSFSGSPWDEPEYYFRTDERFKAWVKGRVRFGRNLPIVAHVFAPLPLVRLSVDTDGCEVWCYA